MSEKVISQPQKDGYSHFRNAVSLTSRVGVYIGAVILNVMILLVMVDVIMRKAFTTPIRGSLEISEIMLGLTVFLGLAFCAVRDEHVVIDILIERFSKHAKPIAMIIIHFVSAGVSVLMSWRLLNEALSLRSGHQVSMLLGLATYPYVLVAFICCAVLALVYLINMLNIILAVKK